MVPNPFYYSPQPEEDNFISQEALFSFVVFSLRIISVEIRLLFVPLSSVDLIWAITARQTFTSITGITYIGKNSSFKRERREHLLSTAEVLFQAGKTVQSKVL